jgi:hypothetical protein
MDLIRQESVVKLAGRCGTLHLEVGMCVVLEVQATITVLSTPITTADV